MALIILLLFVPISDEGLAFEFERMKIRSNYSDDLVSLKENQVIIVWVSHRDLQLYRYIRAYYPTVTHCFADANSFDDVRPGVIVGIRRTNQVEQVKALNLDDLSKLNTKEVIPTYLGLPPGSSAYFIPYRRIPEESWTLFKH